MFYSGPFTNTLYIPQNQNSDMSNTINQKKKSLDGFDTDLKYDNSHKNLAEYKIK